MRFLVDECVDERIVKRLRSAGHDVASARDDLQGAADATLLDVARSERRIMVTEDKDFGRLAVSQQGAASGVILIRLRGAAVDAVILQLLSAMERHGEKL